MITPFSFASTPFIHFGAGKIALLPKVIRTYGTNALILTGASSFTSGTYWKKIQQDLEGQKITFVHDVITQEPSPLQIDRCVEKYKNSSIGVVVAIGGGSVVDAGKAVSAMLMMNDSVKNYLEGIGTKTHPGKKIPFIAVPTTSGTGSETTKNAVLSEVGKDGYKKSLRHDRFVPDVAIVDPELTLSCPKHITAFTGMDAFTQLLESYLSTAANPMTDALALDGLKSVQRSLLLAWEEGAVNIGARTDMSYASMLSGITLANAGLGTVHGFASSIGGYFDIPHGVVCSALMAPANKATVDKLRKDKQGEGALYKYAQAGKLFASDHHQSIDYYVSLLLEKVEQLSAHMSIPPLSSYGVTASDTPKIIAATENKNNPVKLDAGELEQVLLSAL